MDVDLKGRKQAVLNPYLKDKQINLWRRRVWNGQRIVYLGVDKRNTQNCIISCRIVYLGVDKRNTQNCIISCRIVY